MGRIRIEEINVPRESGIETLFIGFELVGILSRGYPSVGFSLRVQCLSLILAVSSLAFLAGISFCEDPSSIFIE